MSGTEIQISTGDGDMMGYLATPASGSGPGVVVIQEVFGVNPWLRQVCDWLAGEGYMALAPDLFWRLQPGVQLDPTQEEEFQQALDLYGKFDVEAGVKDIQASITHLRGLDGCSGKVGTTGFCLGGLLAYLTATRTDSDAASAYYGVGIEGMLGESGNIKVPTLLHIAGADAFVPPEAAAQVRDGLAGHAQVTIHDYPGLGHGFCRETDPSHYDAVGAEAANGRTLELFKSALS